MKLCFSSKPLPSRHLDIYAVPAEDFLSLFAPEGHLETYLPVICYGDSSYLKSSFSLGCADFLKEPWSPEELTFRVCRCVSNRRVTIEGTVIVIAGLHMGSGDGRKITLTYQESVILKTLARQQGKVISREVLAYFLDNNEMRGSRTIDVHISSLRKKIRELLPASSSTNPIQSVRGMGYILK